METYAENLGKESDEIAKIERTTIDYSVALPGQITYKDLGFTITNIVMEDHWLVSFMPSMVQQIQILLYKRQFLHYKPFNSDVMNVAAVNHKDGNEYTDMIFYWNFVLLDNMQTTTRIKFTWLDALSFAGGVIEAVVIAMAIFFGIYNYKIELYDCLYHYENKAAVKEGLLTT